MFARTFNFPRFITSDIPDTRTKVTLLITESRAIEASFSTTGTCVYGTQNGDSQKRLCIHIPLYFFFVDFCDIRKHNKTFTKKNPTRCNNVSKFYYSIFMWSSTCFGRHTAHHQEPKSALAGSGFLYVKGCWTCSWWTTSTNYTSNNLPRIKNQRLPVQF